MSNWTPNTFKARGRAQHYDQDYLDSLIAEGRRLSGQGLPVLFTLGHLAAISGVPFVFLHDVVSRKTDEYRVFFIRKKSGGYRRITIPHPSLASVQRWLLHNILSRQTVHSCSQAFGKHCSPLKNAQQHCDTKWLVKIDVERFFESIKERQVYRVFEKIGFRPLLSFELTRICTRVIDHPARSYVFLPSGQFKYKIASYSSAFEGHLPQGAPTSPMLANLVCYDLDESLNELATKYDCTYTRYADDIVFSTDDFSRRAAKKLAGEAISILRLAGLRLNKKKLKIAPPGTRRIVTGLVVDGAKPKLPKEFRERIKLHLHFAAVHGLAKHCKYRKFRSLLGFRNHLHGLITYAEHVEPAFGAECRAEFNSLTWGLLTDFFP